MGSYIVPPRRRIVGGAGSLHCLSQRPKCRWSISYHAQAMRALEQRIKLVYVINVLVFGHGAKVAQVLQQRLKCL